MKAKGNFDSLQLFQNQPSLNFKVYYAKSTVEHESENCYLINMFLKCFPSLKLYLDEFQSYFHGKIHPKVVIMIFKIIILNIIIPNA